MTVLQQQEIRTLRSRTESPKSTSAMISAEPEQRESRDSSHGSSSTDTKTRVLHKLKSVENILEQSCHSSLLKSIQLDKRKVPILIKKYMVDDMKLGSVVVDFASEAGGNIETITPGESTVYNNVTHIGYTDLPSRLPTQASTLYSNNISKLLLSMQGDKDHYYLDMADDVVRGSIVLNQGVTTWPPNPPISVAAAAAPAKGAAVAAKIEKAEPNYFNDALKQALTYTAGLGTMNALGCGSPGPAFTNMSTTFGLGCIVGYHTVWSVVPALHSPLMSVTNAISGITAVGGLLLMGGGYYPTNVVEGLAASAALISFINIFGGFIVTQRMLDMFKRPTDPPEYPLMMGIPIATFLSAYGYAVSQGYPEVHQMAYLASGTGQMTTSVSSNCLSLQDFAVSELWEVCPPSRLPGWVTLSVLSESAPALPPPSASSSLTRRFSAR